MSTPSSARSARGAAARDAELDIVGRYLSEVGATPLLTAEEEVALARRIEAGVYAAELLRAAEAGESAAIPAARRRALRAVAVDGTRAKDHMIRANLRLVVSLARRHASRGLPLLDVVQEGNLGLIRAVEKFDHTKGFKFSTYAVWWIRQAIDRGLADQVGTVRLPVSATEDLARVTKAERRLRDEHDREPTPAELAEVTGVAPARIAELKAASRAVLSLETPLSDEGTSSVGDLVEDADAVAAHEIVEHQELTAGLRALVATLPARQAWIMTQRYGLVDGRPRTLQEVADELGLTRERIRQLEKESLRLLQEPQRNAALFALAS